MFGKKSLPFLALAFALAVALNGSGGTSDSATADRGHSRHQALAGVGATGSILHVPSAAEPEEGLRRMAGQMVLVGFEGTSPSDLGVRSARAQLASGVIGGVLLFPANIRSAKQLHSLTAFLAGPGPQLTPFIAVDQEGGLVQRLSRSNGHNYFPAAQKVGRDPKFSAPEAAEGLYQRMAQELAKAGINVNFGPVVDLSVNPWNRVIARRKRSFGSDPEIVAKLARAFIAAHRKANILTSAKHFPGHGSSFSDSHKVLPDITRTWREAELQPYAELAKGGMLDMVMIGHLYHPRFSDGPLPASLSARAIEALRDRSGIGFRGVIVSDDMEMDAVRDRHSIEERVVKAINAGVDLLIFSNVKSRDAELGMKVRDIILAAVGDGRISQARVEQAYGRVMRLKRRLVQRDLAGGVAVPAQAARQ